MKGTGTLIQTDHVIAEAPKRYTGVRECARGVKCVHFRQKQQVGRVSSYQEAMPGRPDITLCYACQGEFTTDMVKDSKMTLDQFIGYSTPKKGSGTPGVKVPNLAALRQKKGWSRRELIEKTGFNKDTIGKWERRVGGVSETAMPRLCEVLGCKPEDLTG